MIKALIYAYWRWRAFKHLIPSIVKLRVVWGYNPATHKDLEDMLERHYPLEYKKACELMDKARGVR